MHQILKIFNLIKYTSEGESMEQQILLGLFIGILCLIFMIMKTKIHTFLALIIATILVGLIGGVEYSKIIESITKGFGGTLGSIGIIIGFGVMMGQLFEVSGAAKKMALTFLKIFGKGREELAMAITGFLVSIPIFCDSGFVILTPLLKAISKETKKSIVSLGLALATGLVITHSLVPPTPGPVGVAGIFGVNVSSIILWGIVIAAPMMMASLLFAKFSGNKIWQIPTEDGGWTRDRNYIYKGEQEKVFDEDSLPSTFLAFSPIVVPILLILLGTISKTMSLTGKMIDFIQFVGTPVLAVGIGLILTIYGLAKNMEDIVSKLNCLIAEMKAEFQKKDSSFPVNQLEGAIHVFSLMQDIIISKSFDKDLSNDLDIIMRWSTDSWPWDSLITKKVWSIIEEYNKTNYNY